MNFLLCPPGMQVAVEFLPLALRLEIGGFGFGSYFPCFFFIGECSSDFPLSLSHQSLYEVRNDKLSLSFLRNGTWELVTLSAGKGAVG